MEKHMKKVSILSLLFDEKGNCYFDDIFFDGTWFKYVYINELEPRRFFYCRRCGKKMSCGSNPKSGSLVNGLLYCRNCLGYVKENQRKL